MTIDLTSLNDASRLLFSIELRPIQGDRFQPTGFPHLGAATYQTKDGTKLLVESAQSMANRLEATCWDGPNERPIAALAGISHVTVKAGGKFLTDTMLEAHRLNSPYILENKKDTKLLDALKGELGTLENGPIDRKLLAKALFKYDIGSLLHGVFLAKTELAGGRLRVARSLSAFIEASGARVAASGGVKNDHIHPGKVANDPKNFFGNIPFARDEFTADKIVLHVNFDLAQLRGYGLGADGERLLVLLGLFRLRKLVDGDLRLRTACDLEPTSPDPVADRPRGFALPKLSELEAAVKEAISKSAKDMVQGEVTFDIDRLKPAKEQASDAEEEDEES